MSPTLLSTRLKHLVKSGVVELSGKAGNHTYRLTRAGMELRPIVELFGVWGHRWAQSELNNDDLDAGLLMWDMRRSVDPAVFPPHRIVVQFQYPDAVKGARQWWLISENREVDLCLKDPGFQVDLCIRCSLKVMTEIWTCSKTFRESAQQGELVIMGDHSLADKLPQWLTSSALSRLGSLNIAPRIEWEPN